MSPRNEFLSIKCFNSGHDLKVFTCSLGLKCFFLLFLCQKYEGEAKRLKEQYEVDMKAYREKIKDNPPR